jgi:hypothetical protein
MVYTAYLHVRWSNRIAAEIFEALLRLEGNEGKGNWMKSTRAGKLAAYAKVVYSPR